jgi:hypothetical protein
MKRLTRVLVMPVALCWCCSFCVTNMGDRLDVYQANPKALEIPVSTFAVFSF